MESFEELSRHFGITGTVQETMCDEFYRQGYLAGQAALAASPVPANMTDADLLAVKHAMGTAVHDALFIRIARAVLAAAPSAPAQQADEYTPEFLERARLLAGRLRGTDWCKPDLRAAATLLEEFYLTATAATAPSVEAQADKIKRVLARLDALGDDAAAHIWPTDLERCMRQECVVKVSSVRMGSPDGKTVPLFSREQVAAALKGQS